MPEIASRRIDKGVKRPRLKTGPKPSSPRRNNGQFLPQLPNDPESIRKALVDYSQGATLEQLADKHGVSRQAVYGWLLGDLGESQHSGLVTRALTARIAKEDEVLENGDNPLDVQRGREQARFARMDYERRRPHLYGIKQEVSLTVDLGSALQKIIENRQARLPNTDPIPSHAMLIRDDAPPIPEPESVKP